MSEVNPSEWRQPALDRSEYGVCGAVQRGGHRRQCARSREPAQDRTDDNDEYEDLCERGNEEA
jgi:hypothetical protein